MAEISIDPITNGLLRFYTAFSTHISYSIAHKRYKQSVLEVRLCLMIRQSLTSNRYMLNTTEFWCN